MNDMLKAVTPACFMSVGYDLDGIRTEKIDNFIEGLKDAGKTPIFKECIAVGSDADIVVFDPQANGVISAKSQAYNTDYAPYEGYRTSGRVEQVYLRGHKVVDNHKIVAEGRGVFLQRGKFCL